MEKVKTKGLIKKIAKPAEKDKDISDFNFSIFQMCLR